MQFDQLKRRELLTLFASAATWPLAARAQQSAKLPRIGALVSASPPHPFADALGRGLQRLGYTDGRNITLEFHYSEGRRERAAEIAPIWATPFKRRRDYLDVAIS
jgi:putative ABC transport system substrate-binding protein